MVARLNRRYGLPVVITLTAQMTRSVPGSASLRCRHVAGKPAHLSYAPASRAGLLEVVPYRSPRRILGFDGQGVDNEHSGDDGRRADRRRGAPSQERSAILP